MCTTGDMFDVRLLMAHSVLKLKKMTKDFSKKSFNNKKKILLKKTIIPWQTDLYT